MFRKDALPKNMLCQLEARQHAEEVLAALYPSAATFESIQLDAHLPAVAFAISA